MALLKEIKALFGDTYAKGDLFEDYVAELFPDNVFKMLHATSRSSDFNGRKIESRENRFSVKA